MKIGLRYEHHDDIAILLHAISEGNISLIDSYFVIKYNEDEFHFSRRIEDLKNCDKIFLTLFHIHNSEIDTILKNDSNHKYLQTQSMENYHIPDKVLLEFLNNGNISLSSASVNFEHENLLYDPFFNLIYFYYNLGFNYLNFYKTSNTNSYLLGTYFRQTHVDGLIRKDRLRISNIARSIFENDYTVYSEKIHNDKYLKLLENPNTFGIFSRNVHITSYIDYKQSVCNIIFETLDATSNDEPNTESYNRQYIGEKTLKALLFSEENIFFIWWGPIRIIEYLKNYGFWFLNFEFYDKNYVMNPKDKIIRSPLDKSILDTFKFLKDLKSIFTDNQKVYNFLLERYGNKLEENARLIKQLVTTPRKTEEIIKLLKR